ncbi:hypothetical protein [Novosphingobium sp. CECT 9465]|uniref:hypothetical protein n=1 Tax=Novosphingobium sp. CECT 9465 TaxID=2829794 RepID=UPI001E2868B6|nr:hypothetical protein [Novosphingobium sp. CECT 9465]
MRPAHPAGQIEPRGCLQGEPQQEVTMRSFTAIALPIILAAGLSSMMFTATLV